MNKEEKMSKKITLPGNVEEYNLPTAKRVDFSVTDLINLMPQQSEQDSLIQSILPLTVTDEFIKNSFNTERIVNVEKIGDLPFIMSLPTTQSPHFVTREVKVYATFYYWLIKNYFSNLSEQLINFTPTMLAETWGNSTPFLVANEIYKELQGQVPFMWKNIFGYGVMMKETILYKLIMDTMASGNDNKTLMKVIFLIIMYHMNKRKDLTQNEELLFSEEAIDTAKVYTSFSKELLTEIETRWKNLRFPTLIHQFISEINDKIIKDSNLLSGNVVKLRQGDISTEWPFIIERYVSYLYVNLYLAYQDSLYGALTAKLLRTKSQIINVTNLLKANKMYILEEWITIIQRLEILEESYKKTSMIGGLITTDIVAMYSEMRRTESVFEMASLMHEARIMNDDTHTRVPVREETFQYIANKLRPTITVSIQEMIEELAIGEQWLNVDVDHVDSLLKVGLPEIGIQLVTSSELAKVSIPPTIEIGTSRRTSNTRKIETALISIPTDAYIRFQVTQNSDLQDISFLATGTQNIVSLTAVTINREAMTQSVIPDDYIFPLSAQIKALENDIFVLLEDYGIIDAVEGDSVKEELDSILKEQQLTAYDVIKMHSLLSDTTPLNLDDEKIRTADENTKVAAFLELIDKKSNSMEDSQQQEGVDKASSPSEKLNKLLTLLAQKFDLLQYMGDSGVFFTPLSYKGNNRYSQILLNLVIRSFHNLYISKTTGELQYPLMYYKEDIKRINGDIIFPISSSIKEHKALVPSCNVSKIPSNLIYLPEIGTGLSLIDPSRSMMYSTDALNFKRHGTMLKPPEAYVWTTVETTQLLEMFSRGEFEAAPAGLQSKEFYRVDYVGESNFWKKRAMRSFFSLIANDGTYKNAIKDRSFLTQIAQLHMVKLFQNIPMDWLTGTTESDYRDYKRYHWLTEHYKRYSERAHERLQHIPEDTSLMRRLIFVLLMKVYGYNRTLDAVNDFGKELDRLNIKFAYALTKLQKHGKINTTVRTVINLLLANEELMERALGTPTAGTGLL